MAENVIGGAFLEVLPDTSKFAAALQTQISAALAKVQIPRIAVGGVATAGAAVGEAISASAGRVLLDRFGNQIAPQVATVFAREVGTKGRRAAGAAGEQMGLQASSGFVKGFSVLGGLFIARRIFAFLGGALQQAVRLEDLGKQTAAAIASTGGAAAVSAEQVARLSQSFERLTTIQEETIIDAQNVLLTFTRIRGDVFRQAVEAAANLGVALSRAAGGAIDLHEAAIQVGKALNDPIRGLVNLRRVGVQFTDEQERQIRTLIKAGDVLGAQKIILRELQVEFGNSARLLGEGLGGATRRASDAIGDFTRGLVEALSPAIREAANLVTGFFNTLSELPSPAKAAIGVFIGLSGVGIGLAAITIAAKNLKGAMVSLLGSLTPATAAIAAEGAAAGTSTTLTAALGTAIKGLVVSARAAAVSISTLLLTVPGLGEAILLAALALRTFKDNAVDLGDIAGTADEEIRQASESSRGLARRVLEGQIVVDRTARSFRDFEGNVHTAAATLTQAGSTAFITSESLTDLDLALREVAGGFGLVDEALVTAISDFDAAKESVKGFTDAFDATIGKNIDLAKAQDSLQEAVAKLKTGLRDGTTSFKGFGEAARANRENIIGVVEQIRQLNVSLVLTEQIDARQALALTALQIEILARRTPAAAAALRALVGEGAKAALAFFQMSAAAEAFQNVIRAIAGLPPIFTATEALRGITNAASAFNTTIAKTPPTLAKVDTAVKKTEEKIHPLIAAFNKLKDATSLFNSFLDATTGKILNQLTATANFQEAIDNLGQSLLDNGATFNATTEQGRSNINALVQAVEAAQSEVAALVEAGKIKPTTGAEKAALETRIESLKRTFPEAAALIDRILAQLDKIPGKAKVGPIIKFQVDTKVAEKARADLGKDITANVIFKFFRLTPGGVVPVQITTRQFGGALAAGQTAVVGERGPELITPRAPAQVFSTSILNRLIAALERAPGTNTTTQNIQVLSRPSPVETALEIARRLRAEQFLQTGSF